MPLAFQTAAAVLPGFLRFGRLQLPVFGLVATAGLLAALALSQRTAPLAGLDPHRLWDAGIVAVIGAFVASRLLLLAVNLRLFLAQPLLVLAQPSFTPGGVVLTALIVWLWCRRHTLPPLRVLDAWAPPAALLAAILQLGHLIEGTDAGMPTTLPWGLHTPGDLTFARVHPVQLYAAAAETALCRLMLRGLRRPSSRPPGELASLGLFAGGILSFLLDFFRQPYESLGGAWLDPAQWTAVLASLLGAALWAFLPRDGKRPSRSPGKPVKGVPPQATETQRDVLA